MNQKEARLRDLLRMEVSLKGTQSSWAFMAFSTFIFFYCFNCVDFNIPIKLSMIMVFIVGAWRVKTAAKVRREGHVSDQMWKQMVTSIWLNALGWSIAFNLASFELQLSGIHFIIVTTMLAGFVAASLFTLGYDPILFLPFQFLMLIPQLGIVFYYFKTSETINALPLIPIYLMYFIYQLRQFRDFRSQFLARINYQIDLELSNQELQKSQQALIEQTTKLLHSSRLAALGEMSAGIAHEVNNPLAIIMGSVQQIERINQRQELTSEKISQLTQKALQGIERVTRIIRGLRHFSQQSDSIPKSKTALIDVIEETTSFCSELLSARYIKFKVDQVPLIHIVCNPVQISQVLINLIKNAEDALEEVTEQDERWIHLSFHSNNETVTASVTNGGPKITPEVEAKLFQPFFTTKPVGKGTGIGLSISQGIMREHSGNLAYDSSLPHTTFVMTLPSINPLD